MNYYERHLGDYARDAGYLSMLEHGAYTLLMDRYYATEKGIPDEDKYRIARASSKEEKKAVDSVLKDFFTLENGTWIKCRIEEEITKAQTKIKAAQENGKKGGRPKSGKKETEEKPSGFFMGYGNETQQKAHQTPDTIHQTKTPSDNKTHTEILTTAGDLTPGGVCVLLREIGIFQTNPDHPDLLAALGGGATKSDFSFAATEAVQKNKGFAYMLKIVLGKLEDRKNAKPSPTKTNRTGIDSGFAEKYAGIS